MARENHKKGIGVNFGFSGKNDSDIIPKISRYHTEGRELVKISVLKGEGYLKLVNVLCDFIGS